MQVIREVTRGGLPTWPQSTEVFQQSLGTLVKPCWQIESSSRPTMDYLRLDITSLLVSTGRVSSQNNGPPLSIALADLGSDSSSTQLHITDAGLPTTPRMNRNQHTHLRPLHRSHSSPNLTTGLSQSSTIAVNGQPRQYGIPHLINSDEFESEGNPGYPTAQPMYGQLVLAPSFHRLLDGGRNGGPALRFDLSSPVFELSYLSGAFFAREQLEQSAIWPPVTHMVITCNALPHHWLFRIGHGRLPSQLLANTYHSRLPDEVQHPNPTIGAVTVYDVLFAIHHMLQRQITHEDWGRLSKDESRDITRAYTRRCRKAFGTQEYEESQGVRRVDYLKSRHMFKGLVRIQGEGFEHVRLRVGR